MPFIIIPILTVVSSRAFFKRDASVGGFHISNTLRSALFQIVLTELIRLCNDPNEHIQLHRMIECCGGKIFLQQTKPTLYDGEDSLGEKLIVVVQCKIIRVEIHCLFHEFVLASAVTCLLPLLNFLCGFCPHSESETVSVIAHKTSIPAA